MAAARKRPNSSPSRYRRAAIEPPGTRTSSSAFCSAYKSWCSPETCLARIPAKWGGARQSAWLCIALAIGLVGCAPDAPDVDWPAYLGDEARTHYSPLTDINPSNVASLEVAWRYDAGDLAPGISVMDTSPLVVDGVLYGLSPTLDAFALNAATGEELWRHETGDTAIGHSQRGLLWWSGDQTDVGNRLFYVAGVHLFGLNPDTGQPLSGFGEGGRLDLSNILGGYAQCPRTRPRFRRPHRARAIRRRLRWRRIGRWRGRRCGRLADSDQAPVRWRAGGVHGVGRRQGPRVCTHGSGYAYGVRGGARLAGDLNASGVVALDASTGEARWFQPIYTRESWPGRLASPPTLVAFERDGAVVAAVALATRRGHLYLLDSGIWGTSDGDYRTWLAKPSRR